MWSTQFWLELSFVCVTSRFWDHFTMTTLRIILQFTHSTSLYQPCLWSFNWLVKVINNKTIYTTEITLQIILTDCVKEVKMKSERHDDVTKIFMKIHVIKNSNLWVEYVRENLIILKRISVSLWWHRLVVLPSDHTSDTSSTVKGPVMIPSICFNVILKLL